MPLTPQQLKNVGTVVGIVVFAGPLAALYFSMSGWDADEALRAKHETERQKRREADLEHRRTAAARLRTPATKVTTKPAPAAPGPGPGPGATDPAPLELRLQRVSNYKMELTFTNVSDAKLRLAVPDGPGGLVRIVPVGRPPPRAISPLYDDDRDDYRMSILAGAQHRIELKRQAGFPRGPVRAVYDSRGPGVPEKAWRGTVESPPIK